MVRMAFDQGPGVNNDSRYAEAVRRRQQFLAFIMAGHSISSACRETGITDSAYRKWRQKAPRWAAQVDAARVHARGESMTYEGTFPSFVAEMFNMQMSAFQIEAAQAIIDTPPGNILMILFPPEHGKTTTYENWACYKLSANPDWRGTVASENITISRKIVSRVRSRLEAAGPYPELVARFGPFEPQKGVGRSSQTWSQDRFNVYRKNTHDERDYSLIALGYGSSIVSTRTDHLHIDDVQSTKTANETDKIEEWFRQDALSRPGEHGITTIMGTRVCEDDFYERIAEDTDLDGILRVIRLPAIVRDRETQELRPLWPERYTMDQLDRQRRKVGQEAWDRNYMQNPGASTRGKGTFSAEIVDRCKRPLMSLRNAPSENGVVYVGLDPALGSMNCVIACEATADGKLIVRRIREDVNFQRNEQIMAALEDVVVDMNQTAMVTDVVIEAMNFQKGLARDERLEEMERRYGFTAREHLTGVNKYDEDIGVPSMASAFQREEILLPWADDEETRHEIGELRRQLLAWKPKKRGNKLRQDRVMALWFVWILWRSRYKKIDHARPDTSGWHTGGLPFTTVPSGLIVPIGARV